MSVSNPTGWAISNPETAKEKRERRNTMPEKGNDNREATTYSHMKKPHLLGGSVSWSSYDYDIGNCVRSLTKSCPPSGSGPNLYLYIYTDMNLYVYVRMHA